MGVPITYRKSVEGVTASYNYIDIAEGTGIVIFYGGVTGTTGGGDKKGFFSTNRYYSDFVSSNGALDINFDTGIFNLPKTIKGTCHINFACLGVGHVKVTLKKVATDGTTETDISSQIDIDCSSYKMYMAPIAITTTHFKKGEKLRMELITTVSSSTMEVGHDPMGRAGTGITTPHSTIMQLFVPFQLDL